MKQLLICMGFFLLFSCKDKKHEEAPVEDKCEELNLFADEYSEWCSSAIMEDYYWNYFWDIITDLGSVEEMITYYELIGGGYTEGNYSNVDDYRTATIEFALAQDSVQRELDDEFRLRLLTKAIERQTRKMTSKELEGGGTPLSAVQTGILLFIRTLQNVNAQTELDRICEHYSDNNTYLTYIFSEDLNYFIINCVSEYLTDKTQAL